MFVVYDLNTIDDNRKIEPVDTTSIIIKNSMASITRKLLTSCMAQYVNFLMWVSSMMQVVARLLMMSLQTIFFKCV